MFGFKKNITTISDIQNLIIKNGQTSAGEIIRDRAINGNLLCQKFLSGAALQIPKEKRTSKLKKDIELFTKLAAENGDPESQFNLALFYTQEVDPSKNTFSEQDIAFLSKAKYWHEQAASRGFAPSIRSLKNIKIALGEV